MIGMQAAVPSTAYVFIIGQKIKKVKNYFKKPR